MKNYLGKLTNNIVNAANNSYYSDYLNNKFNIGDNSVKSLDGIISGQSGDYGALGDFSKLIDKTSERKYLEQGYLRQDSFQGRSNQFELLMQQPSATLLIKKKMFSSVADNYKVEYMDADEKFFFKATKILFQNKCKQIAKLEVLSKIQKITEYTGTIDDTLLPVIVGLMDDNSLFSGLNNNEINDFVDVISKLRRIYSFNKTSLNTNWITDDSNLFSTQFGQGTGVIEITNFTNFTTSSTLSLTQSGRASFKIADPYNVMTITEHDIEKAISDSLNMYFNSSFYQFGKQNTNEIIENLKYELNSMRSRRGVGNITFSISEDSIVGKNVIAIIDNIGLEVKFSYEPGFLGINNLTNFDSNGNISVDAEYLENGTIAGKYGLSQKAESNLNTDNINYIKLRTSTDSELSVFKRLIMNIYNLISLNKNSDSDIAKANTETNYVRRKLRFTFLGKSIIQPMDTVNVFIDTKSRYDNKLTTGITNMFTGYGILQNLNKTIFDLKNSFSLVFNPSGNIEITAEKNLYVGESFPNWLWSLVRRNFVNEKEGTHVFGGVVTNVSTSCNDGAYNINIDAEDNSYYLKQGKINFKPGVDVFNGSLFDPLTPFKTKFDSVSSNVKSDALQLLDENIDLLSDGISSTPLIKFKSGANAGRAVTHNDLVQEQTINKNTQLTTKTFFAPNGLVYRWKEGIGGLVYSGDSLSRETVNSVGIPNIAENPFAGQDVMNVISLSITGVPYNFKTYLEAISNFDGFNYDNLNNENASNSYYRTLTNDLKKQNSLWGNFIPFKSLSVDEQSYSKSLKNYINNDKKNKDIEDKLKKAQELQKQVVVFSASSLLSENDQQEFISNEQKASHEFNEILKQIDSLLLESRNESKNLNNTDVFGQSALDDFSSFIDNSDDASNISRRKLRRQMNYLTRRMSYNIRANEDKNYLIIDDSYDKDYDLMAFTKNLVNGIDLYNNDFLDVVEKIESSAKLLHLEVFCDTQGHIKVRTPQYNRMPSSVFYKMMQLKETKGIQIFPQFLNDLFTDQITTLSSRLEILEDEIRLFCAMIGNEDDLSAQTFINNDSEIKGAGDFKFLTVDGNLVNYKNILNNDVDLNKDQLNQSLTELNSQAKTNKSQFSIYQKVNSIIISLTKNKLQQNGINTLNDFTANFRDNAYLDKLISRIRIKSGNSVNINKFDYIIENIITNNVEVSGINDIDIYKVNKQIYDLIRDRQKIIKLLSSSVNSAKEFNYLDTNENSPKLSLFNSVNNNKEIPEVFENLIEDESYDDVGINSGTRYIIKDSQIISMTLREESPEYTYIQIRGVQNPFSPNSLPAGLNNFPQNGNGLVTADAIDYDLWRMYGFKQVAPITIPFFNDPINQCLPYAVMLLSKARKNILRGEITISGNEHMQQGEVVFLESRNLLFYVDSVSHNYTEGSSFTTSLRLSYGHPPGDYIPVPLDLIGKLIYNNKDIAENVIQRHGNSFNEVELGVIVRDPNLGSDNVSEYEYGKSTYSVYNTNTLNNILNMSGKILESNLNSNKNNLIATVELRYYIDSKNPSNYNLSDFAESIKKTLSGEYKIPKNNSILNNNNKVDITISVDNIKIVEVDLSDSNDYRSPSQKAFDMSRNLIESLPDSNLFKETKTEKRHKDKLKNTLHRNIVDCWIKFEQSN